MSMSNSCFVRFSPLKSAPGALLAPLESLYSKKGYSKSRKGKIKRAPFGQELPLYGNIFSGKHSYPPYSLTPHLPLNPFGFCFLFVLQKHSYPDGIQSFFVHSAPPFSSKLFCCCSFLKPCSKYICSTDLIILHIFNYVKCYLSLF